MIIISNSNDKKAVAIVEIIDMKYILVLILCVLAIYAAINVYTLSIVEGTFFFPTYAGGTIILSALSGIFFFKDKLNGKQIFGVILGIIAVVLMNF